MEQIIKCPVCGEEIKETYYSSELGLVEDYINCNNCGYFYEICFGPANEGVHNLNNSVQLSILKENIDNLRKVGLDLVISPKGIWQVISRDELYSDPSDLSHLIIANNIVPNTLTISNSFNDYIISISSDGIVTVNPKLIDTQPDSIAKQILELLDNSILPSKQKDNKDKYLYGLRNMKTKKIGSVKCKGGKFYEKLSYAKERCNEINSKKYNDRHEVVKFKLTEVSFDE